MWPDGVDSPPEVVVAVRGQGIEEFSLPAPYIILADQDLIGDPGQATVGRSDVLIQGRHQTFPGSDQNFPSVRQALVPDVEGARHIGTDPPTGLA